jgi:predicted kinase
MKIIILKGLPASGKSTWARQFCKENKSFVRVNRDDLRRMRGEYWVPEQESLITQWERTAVLGALISGVNVVLDSTNLNEKYLQQFKDYIIDNARVQVEFEEKVFDTSVEECIRRDAARPEAERVGEKVIRRMYDQYLKREVKYEENKDLPPAIIVDIDGTLAKMNGRGPFEWYRVGEDHVHDHIRTLVNILGLQTEYHIVIFSGRDGSCLPQTIAWLNMHGIYFDEIFMRPEGNNEKDSVIKKRLFEQHVRGKYYVVLDDRDQVVKMWRHELGLPCLQVAEGNF